MSEKKPPAQVSAAETRAKVKRYYDGLVNRNYFQIFGADKDTDPERIKAAYHNLARQWHSDAYAGVDLGDARDMQESIFKLITEAYETITDPKKKAEYLTYLDRRSKGLSTDVNAVLQGERLFDEAIALIARRNWAGAKEKLEKAMESNPDDPLMKSSYAWAMFNADRKSKSAADTAKQAIEMLKSAVKKQEHLAPAYQYLGQIYFALDMPEEAKKWWKKCIEWDESNIEASRGIRLVTSRAGKKSTGGVGGFLGKLFGKK